MTTVSEKIISDSNTELIPNKSERDETIMEETMIDSSNKQTAFERFRNSKKLAFGLVITAVFAVSIPIFHLFCITNFFSASSQHLPFLWTKKFRIIFFLH